MIFLVDIDGTLAKMSMEYIALATVSPKNWPAFNHHIPKDDPIDCVMEIVKLLYKAHHKILIVTARSEECKEESEKWLQKNGIFYDEIYMRKQGDTRSDFIIKSELLAEIREKHGEPSAVFDDRRGVIDQFQSEGVFTFDVSQGKVF